MASLSQIRAVVARLGVTDPENPSPAEVKLVLDAYLKNKSLDTEAFNIYVKSLSVPLKAMFEGFGHFSANSKDVSKRTIDIIQRAMDILGGELHRETSDDRRREILDHVLHLVNDARDESDKHRSFLLYLAKGMLAVVVVVTGVLMVVVTLGKRPEILEKGLELLARSAVKA